MRKYRGSLSTTEKVIVPTYASPSSSESFPLGFLVLLPAAPVTFVLPFGPPMLFFSDDSLTFGVDDDFGEGEEMGLASVSEGLAPSSSEESPASARSSASRSAMIPSDG